MAAHFVSAPAPARRSLYPATPAKIFLAVLAACAIVLAVNGIGSRVSFERSFLGYLNEQGLLRIEEVVPRLEAGYAEHGDWAFVKGHPRAWFGLMWPGSEPPPLDEVPPVSDQTGVISRLALLDADGAHLIGNPAADDQSIRRPVVVGGATVGWLAMVPFEKAIADGDVRFYRALQRASWLNIGASVIVAALLAWALSRILIRRVAPITDGIRGLAAGDYRSRVPEGPDDELGRLAGDLNRLADVLDHTEQHRRDFMADVSHELRTPLSVLRAELEAIQDGIRPLRPESLAPLQSQVGQLGKLIDDLHELAMTQAAPSYRLASLDLTGAVRAAAASMSGRFADAGLRLELDLPLRPVLVDADERRLQQLLANLLENSLRYTDSGGIVVIAVGRGRDEALVTIDDSAPGVDADRLPRLFERFYRAETSRSRASGGSGLGLAICQRIVEAHRGSVEAEPSPLGGLTIRVRLPLFR